ncbi:MAG: alkaline phosphatase PhoX [Aestuariivirga sp.]
MTSLRSILLSGTILAGVSAPVLAGTIEFTPVAAPTDDAGKRQVNVSQSVKIDGADHAIKWNTMARSGQKIGDGQFGVLTDASGKVLFNSDGTPSIADSADFTSILPVGGKIYSITHFESRPAAMYLSEITQAADGTLTPVSTRAIDFSVLGGLWNPCAGSVTPWNTHLGSEEYPPDARSVETADSYADLDEEMLSMALYFGVNPALAPLAAFKAVFQPYKYGFPVEISVNEAGETAVAKHYAMGRVAVELALVMPDRKTAYISDDGTNTGLYRFVADKEGDLTSGQLFAAKWNQTSADGAGSADISWVDLGHGNDADVAAALKFGVKFSDIFETAKFNEDGSCPEGFLSSNAEGRSECLRVKAGMEVYASRLETRRYASMLGATTEFRKMEGLAFDGEGKRLFLAMSEVSNGMENAAKENKYDKGGRNDIKLGKNGCGAVYELPFDADYKVTAAKGFITGKPNEYKDGPYAGQTCDIDGIANPDNLSFIPGYNTLLIGEDTGSGHQNDASWAVNAETKAMTRITMTPYGAENTSLDWYADINGYAYLTTVVQHPYGESDTDKLQNPEDARAYVGYIGPFPAFKKSALAQ